VAGGDQLATQHVGVFQKDFELDFPVAEDVRVGRAASLVLRQKVLEDVVPVFGGKVGRVQAYAQGVAYPLRIR